jgi:dienelactone hydrolase
MHIHSRWLPGIRKVCFGGAITAFASLFGCGTSVPGPDATTTVALLAADDLASGCRYDVVLPRAVPATAGTVVMFDRADTVDLFNDLSVRTTASSLGIALVLAHECNAKSYADLQVDAAKGPGRALFVGLQQLATATNHPELATHKIVLYGFSAAGVLATTMTNYAPQSILGAVAYAPGSAYVDLDDVKPSPASAAIPVLILANAKDTAAGTTRGYSYFQRGRALNAPWAFAVQNGVGHCCNLSTRDVILPWMAAVLTAAPAAGPTQSTSSASSNRANGTPGSFVCSPDGIVDAQGDVNCNFTSAAIGPTGSSSSEIAGWLPNSQSANAWLSWVKKASGN